MNDILQLSNCVVHLVCRGEIVCHYNNTSKSTLKKSTLTMYDISMPASVVFLFRGVCRREFVWYWWSTRGGLNKTMENSFTPRVVWTEMCDIGLKRDKFLITEHLLFCSIRTKLTKTVWNFSANASTVWGVFSLMGSVGRHGKHRVLCGQKCGFGIEIHCLIDVHTFQLLRSQLLSNGISF